MADTAPEMVDTVPAETAVENEDDAERTTKMEAGDFSDEDLSSFERPRNMFDITEMTYDDYVEKHYEIMGKNMKEKLRKTSWAPPVQWPAAEGALPPGSEET